MITTALDQMTNKPHPFVNGAKMSQMVGQHVALVGKVESIESGLFTMRTTDELEVYVTTYEPNGED